MLKSYTFFDNGSTGQPKNICDKLCCQEMNTDEYREEQTFVRGKDSVLQWTWQTKIVAFSPTDATRCTFYNLQP